MRSLSGLGIGLSLFFGCLFLALVAELYFLWWRKRLTNIGIDNDYRSSARQMFFLFCWKKPSSLSSTALNPQELCTSVRITDAQDHEMDTQPHLHSGSNKDLLLKPFGEDSLESELKRLHNLSGPPRFLFTIKEEVEEDLESEDAKSKGGKSRKGSKSRSLSDLLLTVETPFLTPVSSPPFFTPRTSIDCYNHPGFNPLFDSSTNVELGRIRFSPPPKFKFLKDAEEKLYRKLMEEADKMVLVNGGSVQDGFVIAPPTSSVVTHEEDGSLISIIVDKNKEGELHQHLPQHHSSSSQVLPLASSPTIRPSNKKAMFHENSMVK